MLVLQSQFTFKHDVSDMDNLSLIGTEKGFQLAHEFNTVRESILYKNLDEISDYARRNKNPVKGLVITRDSDGNFHQIKVNRNGYHKEGCDINITIKNSSEKKKTLSFKDKMDLLRAYVLENKELPDSTVVVNDCKLGTFVKKLGVDEEHVAEFNEIKNSIPKTPKRK